MKVYYYAADTKEFLHTSDAQIDPLESEAQERLVWLLPANATFAEPPEAEAGFARIWNGEAWQQVEDNRGLIVWRSFDEYMQIAELGPIPEGWTIERPAKPVTKSDLAAFVSAEADKVAYGGITIVANGQKYLFKTTTDNITRCNSVLAMYEVLPDETVIPWEVWQGEIPVMLPVDKAQFKQCFAFGANMIIEAETVKGALNAMVQTFTDEQLANRDFVQAFQEKVVIEFAAVETAFSLDETA